MHQPLELQQLIENKIKKLVLPKIPMSLYEPFTYIMNLGGKRIRPVIVLMATELFTDDLDKAIDVAMAIEIFHNFTLVHDDIMDKAPLRRGQKTVHEKWGDNTAILVGDVMMVETNKHLCKTDSTVLKEVLDTFNIIAQGVCEGQQLDMEFENRNDVSIEEYIEMIRKKTAVLLGGAMKLGAIVGGASHKDADLLYQFGENLGIAFQLQDDILDVYGNPEKFGKKVGGDIIANKKTYLHIQAKNKVSETEKELLLADYELQDEKIKTVTSLYNQYQVKEMATAEMSKYLSQSFQAFSQISTTDYRKSALNSLAQDLMNREF